ncbi:MAG TPA: acetyl-CoA carboxylase, carboxyltransferase subunit beta [Candidatus Baltobacteraceae bacterium]|jgi:acetyl-CoA carboxylase carboxyl transferase subunit beta|nr:acetyl-CoA carboxylase, carboxyltransferase subunit beta [Candidatus Baltobacteraceae bacterium]
MATTSFTKKTIGLDTVEPAVTPPPSDATASFVKKHKLASSSSRKRDIPEGLWTKCKKCAVMIYDKELDANLKVCPKCQYHFPIGARERIHALVETCSFEETNASMESVDILKFTGVSSYTAKLEQYQKESGLKDAVCTGIGRINRHRVALGVMDFGFLGGSMGSVVGEKLTRLFEAATDKGLPIVTISASAGARMYEGMFSLMQMAKTCGALAYHARNKLPHISVLTNPTLAGVMASFASVGDLILAEPGAMIGFAGPRVIESTTQSELPADFQTAEFLLEHGLIDAIVPRLEMKARLSSYLEYLMEGREHLAALGG